MAENNTLQIEELKQKIQHLFSIYNALKLEKELLVNEKIQLVNTIEEQKSKYSEIEKKYKSLQIANAVTSNSGDSEFAKKKIDGIVREIDKCVALLNQ